MVSQGKEPAGQFRQVPQRLDARKRIWLEALALASRLPRQRPMARGELLAAANAVIQAAGADASCAGYAMVMLNNAFWHDQYVGVPLPRRLLLLPRCLIRLAEVEARAQALGYKVHVADGTPIVVRLLAEEEMDGILGVGCLDSLEKAFNKVQQVGVPAIAIPLNNSGCKQTDVDMDLLLFFLEGHGPAATARTRNYLPLLRMAYQMFSGAAFQELLGPLAQNPDPATRAALDWLQRGGKRLRPFATLASFAAFAPDLMVPDSVKRVALAMEVFHKASLVHDDIEDDDELRYGEQTLHRRYGTPAAINAGDYLVGLGYHLAQQGAAAVSAEAACQVLALLSRAHVELTIGQGAELSWPGKPAEDLTLAAALRRYMLKSSPAFEAALGSGMILAGVYSRHEKAVHAFCKHLGAAFQVQNDISGWEGDAARARPTVLRALALETATPAEREALLKPPGVQALREIYARGDVCARGRQLVERLRQHALQVLEAQDSEPLSELLRFLLETIIESAPAGAPTPAGAHGAEAPAP